MRQIKFLRKIYNLRFALFSIFIGKREGGRLLSEHPSLQHCKQFILFQEQDIEGKIKSRKLIIPGKVAVLKGELEAKMPGWEIIIAPNEAVQLVKFMKDFA